jgi:hypothetical protein
MLLLSHLKDQQYSVTPHVPLMSLWNHFRYIMDESMQATVEAAKRDIISGKIVVKFQ